MMQLANGSKNVQNRCLTDDSSSIIIEFGEQLGEDLGIDS